MKARTRKIFSVMLSLLMTLMYMTTASVYADYQAIPEQSPKSMNKMTFFMDNAQVQAGSDLQLDIKAINPVAIKSLEHIILTVPNGFEVTGMSDSSSMFGGSSVTYEVSGNSLNFSITSDGSINENGTVATINLHVSENCTPQTYDFKWVTTAMSCKIPTGSSYAPTFLMGRVTVGDSGGTTQTTTTSSTTTTTTTTDTTQTTTTPIIYDPRGWISLNSQPYKTEYYIGEQLDLTGLTINFDYYNYKNEHEIIYSGISPMDKPDDFTIDTSDFNPYNTGTYKINVSCSNDFALKYFASDNFASVSFEVTVKEPETTTTTSTTTSTTTTTSMTSTTTTVSAYLNVVIDSLPTKTAYTVGEELDLSGGAFSYEGMFSNGTGYGHKPVNMTGNEYIDTSEFDSSKTGTYRIYIKVSVDFFDETLYGENYFEVTVSEPETTTTTSTTTTTTTTTTSTTTTASAYINVTIDSLPTKTAYTVGEELDLSGGKWHSDGIKSDGTPFNSVPYDMTNNSRVDTSAFDNTKAGTYRIYLRENINGLYGENFFDVTVSEPATTLGDINGDGFIDSVDATAVLIEYAKLSASGIGTFDDNQKKSADLNNDGLTDSVDATLIMMYYAYVSAGKNDTLENWLFTNNI